MILQFKKKSVKRVMLLIAIAFLIMQLFNSTQPTHAKTVANTSPWWSFQSIDTMKYSRDPSREFLSDPVKGKKVISQQVAAIAKTGVTHIAIATPYDDEFLPILNQWVDEARNYNLKVWFRGNWSGWERWFGYAPISRKDHLQKTVAFIKNHPDIFENGDVFTSCPECENGGPGDPRHNGDAEGHKQFLIEEYQAMQEAFRSIDKNVQANMYSMNGDVAKLIMDKKTTQALGGRVVIDHYVRSPEQLMEDIVEIAQLSGGKVILGEYGAPIPDIHGSMSEQQQAEWLKQSLTLLAQTPELDGINYWTSFGGSTEIWKGDGSPKAAVEVLTQFYSPRFVTGSVQDVFGDSISGVRVASKERQTRTTASGSFQLPYFEPEGTVILSATGYKDVVIPFELLRDTDNQIFTLEYENPSVLVRLKLLFSTFAFWKW